MYKRSTGTSIKPRYIDPRPVTLHPSSLHMMEGPTDILGDVLERWMEKGKTRLRPPVLNFYCRGIFPYKN